MSILSRLFGKSHPAPAPPAESKPAPPAQPPRPDPAIRAREEEASLAQAIEAGDMAAVGKWVLEGSSTKIRQAAARAISNPDQLLELIRATRGGKDKTVYRILTTARDAQLSEIRRTQQLRADIEEAATAIARHSERAFYTTYDTTLERLAVRWHSLAPQATPELQQTVAEQLERARGVVERHREEVAAEQERQRTEALAAEEAQRQRQIEAQAAESAAAEQARIRDAEREAEREAERAKREADEAAVRELIGLLRQTESALEHGGTARAERLRAVITEKLPSAPPLPAWYARKLEQVDARILELKDWKTFTVVPKRAQLLQQMQALIGAELSPEEVAKRIRHLRDDWRTLHRGAGDEPTPELQQFDELAERAYEPCREHFAKQAEQRRENQAKREALLERLTAFAAEQSGENVNWRAVQQALVESRREWRQYAPVDQAVVKSLQERFHALVDDLQARLSAEYERNVQAKRELIARTAELVNLEETRAAIEEAKNLQRTWKTVGLVPRQQSDALWEEFRKNCDAVFERSSREHAAYGASLEANQARAVGLCEEIERIAALSGEELQDGLRRLDDLRTQFGSLELPRASARELRQRFSHANDQCAAAMHRNRAATARRSWTEVFVAAAKVNASALAMTAQRPPEECEALRATAAAAIAGLERSPKEARGVLEQKMTGIGDGAVGSDLAANAAALRMLCLRAELIAGLPSPPEDQDLRREYQMQRLVAKMGRGEHAAPTDLDALALEWLAVGPVETEAYEKLFARFEACRNA